MMQKLQRVAASVSRQMRQRVTERRASHVGGQSASRFFLKIRLIFLEKRDVDWLPRRLLRRDKVWFGWAFTAFGL